MTPNTEWKKAGLSICAGAGFFLICIVALFTIDGMNGGFAIAFIALFLTISSIPVALLYVHRAMVMDAILRDPYPLARWKYPDEMVQETIDREYHEYQERNRAMFIMIGGMLVVVALLFILIVEDGGLETGIVLLIIAGILFIVSRGAPLLERNRARIAPREAFITRDGIIYHGSVYPFRSFLVSRPQVTFDQQKKKDPAMIVFSFTQMTGMYIVQPFDVTVPVPPGEEENARRIVRELGGDGAD